MAEQPPPNVSRIKRQSDASWAKKGRSYCARIKSLHASREVAVAVSGFCDIPMLGWKTCQHFYENRQTPRPKANPAQEKLG